LTFRCHFRIFDFQAKLPGKHSVNVEYFSLGHVSNGQDFISEGQQNNHVLNILLIPLLSFKSIEKEIFKHNF